MELLKKIFPFSFGAKDVAGLVIKCLILLVVGVVIGFVIGYSLFCKADKLNKERVTA